MPEKLRFTIAVDHLNTIKPKHFGDADKFLIYEYRDKEIRLMDELTNQFKTYDEKHGHGSISKGKAIARFLKDHGVHVLVSKQFGKNIQIVNRYFVPVLVSGDKPQEVIPVLQAHINIIRAEWKKNTETYQHLNLKKSVLQGKEDSNNVK
jgi:predicted Fe-Mo cluster-binding NifX family protein